MCHLDTNAVEFPARNTIDTSGEMQQATHLAVFAHGQTRKVTEQNAQVFLKQTGISQVLSC